MTKENETTSIRVKKSTKQRLESLRGKLMTASGRQFTQGEVLDILLTGSEHQVSVQKDRITISHLTVKIPL